MKTSIAVLLCAVMMIMCSCSATEKGDIDKAEEGMGIKKVKDLVGEPLFIEKGDGVHASMEAWHYEKGSVYFDRLSVIKVIHATPEYQQRLITKLKEKEKSYERFLDT